MKDAKFDIKYDKMDADRMYEPDFLENNTEWDPSVHDRSKFTKQQLAEVKKNFDKLWAEGGAERL